MMQTLRSPVDSRVDGFVVGEFLGQRPQKRQYRDEPPVLSDLYVENVDLQRIADSGASDIDGPGQEMRARAGRQRFERRKIIARDQVDIVRQGLLSS